MRGDGVSVEINSRNATVEELQTRDSGVSWTGDSEKVSEP
jgi:hypothetical protein